MIHSARTGLDEAEAAVAGRPAEYVGKATVVGAHGHATGKGPAKAAVAAELEIQNEPSWAQAAVEEAHGHLVAALPRLVVVLEALAAAHIRVDGEAEAVEGVGTAMEAVDSIAEGVDVLWAAETAGCYEAASAVVRLEVVDMEVPI